ncbi:MAG: ImmA/IrrE family metallo-endopeptidase [Pyrinomonadaceae bacterium]
MTGRFSRRPYYEPHELDAACERLVTDFLLQKYGEVKYPICTDDLTIMLEKEGVDLDLYADFPDEEDVEGVAEFVPNERTRVKISRRISEAPNMVNRLRTTITHEHFHVKFHSLLFSASNGPRRLATLCQQKAVCKRQTVLNAGKNDWMEWQAGYGCAAILMPVRALTAQVKSFLLSNGILRTPIETDSVEGRMLIQKVMAKFQVSRQAATIRLLQHGSVTNEIVLQRAFRV